MGRVRLPGSAHTARPWRIHALTRDFRLEDVWALPTPGGPDDLARLVDQLANGSGAGAGTPIPGRVPRFLFALRWKLGALFGWDDAGSGVGGRVASLRDRLPPDLRDDVRTNERGRVILTEELEETLARRLVEETTPLAEAGKLGAFLVQMTPAFKPGRYELEELDNLVSELR